MFNIFEEEKEEISEPAKVRMLVLQKVQHPQLQAAVDALKVRSSIDGLSFSSHLPTDDELVNCRRLVLCSNIPWDPNDPSFALQERAEVHHHSDVSAVRQHGDCGYGDFRENGNRKD